MEKLTKEAYYDKRGQAYESHDQEAVVRYENVLVWLDVRDVPVVYEIGCKFGELNRMLLASGESFKYKAVDIDLSTLLKIPEYTEDQFVCGNANDGLPFSDNSADFIVCLEVMEHLENATFFLDEVKRVLKKGGKLILSVPNPYCWMEFFGNFRKKSDTEGHVATYTYQNIDALMSFSLLKLIDMTGTFTRVPFSKRLFGKIKIFETNKMFLTRSYMFLIEKQ